MKPFLTICALAAALAAGPAAAQEPKRLSGVYYYTDSKNPGELAWVDIDKNGSDDWIRSIQVTDPESGQKPISIRYFGADSPMSPSVETEVIPQTELPQDWNWKDHELDVWLQKTDEGDKYIVFSRSTDNTRFYKSSFVVK